MPTTKLTEQVRPLILLNGVSALTGGGAGKLDGIATVGLSVPINGIVMISGTAYLYQLKSGTTAESSPNVIRPDDYATTTNEKIWQLQAISLSATTTGALLAANNLSDLVSPSTARTSLGLGTAAVKTAGAANGVADLDSGGRVPIAQLPAALAGALQYQGTWNASTNSPALASGVGTTGFFYKVSVAGTTTIDTVSEWNVGDMILFNGTIWDKIDNSEEDATTSLKGRVQLAGDLAGTAAAPLVKALTTDFKITGLITPTALATGNTNDWAPTGLSSANVIAVTLNSFAATVLTGLTGGVDGRVIYLYFTGVTNPSSFKLSHDDTNSTAANRFYLGMSAAGKTLPMNTGKVIGLRYNGTLSRWCIIGDVGVQATSDLGGSVDTPLVRNISTFLALTGVLSPAQITADQNNYSPGTNNIVCRISSDAARSITGWSASVATGNLMMVHNIGSFPITLVNQSASSSAGNRFDLGADFILPANGVVWLYSDPTATRWRIVNQNLYLQLVGGTLTGPLVVSSRITADKWTNSQSALTYAATTDLDFDGLTAKTLALTGNVTFTTSNRAAGRMKKINILCDGTNRNFTWPAWIPIGAALPASITAGKTAILTLECWGANDTDITAAYAVQP